MHACVQAHPAWGSVRSCRDGGGCVQGVKLTRQLMGEAGRALKQNITTLGPLVLPLSEQLLFFCNLIARKLFKMAVKAYIPDFRLAFDHFCIHTGGRAVIEEIEKQLKLRPEHVAPSKDTLFRFGNTSSSSIWWAPRVHAAWPCGGGLESVLCHPMARGLVTRHWCKCCFAACRRGGGCGPCLWLRARLCASRHTSCGR